MIIWSFVHTLTFLIYVYLGIYVLVKDPKSPLNRLAFFFSSCFAIWTFGLIFIHNPDTPESILGIAETIVPFGWIGFCSFIFWFFLIFTERTKITRSKYFYPLLFILPVMLVYKQLSSGSIIVGNIEQPYGWIPVWGRSFWTYLFFAYLFLYVGATIFLIYDYWRKTSNALKKRQAKIFFISGLASFIIGVCSNIVLPMLNIVTIPDLATLFSLIWVVGTVYAMVRYRFLAITPATAADNIISTMADCLILLDEYGDIITVNEATLNLLHYDKKELCGRSVDTLFNEERLRSGVSGDIIQGDNFKNRDDYFITKSGENIPVSLSCSVLTDEAGATTGFVYIVRDMTEYKKTEQSLREAREGLEALVQERTEELEKTNVALRAEIKDKKLAEEALQASEEKYRTILESMEDGYFEVDIEGNFRFFNRALCERLGYAPEKLVGMNYKAIMDKENGKKLFHEFNKVFTTGIPIKNIEVRVISKGGAVKIVETPISLIRDINNEPVGFRGLARDVTEQRDLEIRFQRAQKMEAIGELAGGVAHDLNNILSGIVSYPEIILMDLPTDSHLRKPILTILKSGEKAASVVEDLLTLARRGTKVEKVTNLNSIISDYLQSLEFKKLISHYPKIQIETKFESRLLNILGSPVHLSKTVMNLVSNAVEASGDRGKISICTRNQYIDRAITGYDTVGEGDYIILTVSDTGVGIPLEDREKIFEPFYTTKTMGRSGTGLGLAVVWGSVKDHNGYIDIKSSKGKGTSFELYFPATRKEISKDRSPLLIEKYKGKGESILIVDDVKTQREIASKILLRLGYVVDTVSSGEKAIEYLQDNQIDLLVLDMIMDPGIDGLETYKRILQLHPKQRAIIASGFSETVRVKEAQSLGAGQYLKKPYTSALLSKAVRRELDRR